jgi:hypothetical protein
LGPPAPRETPPASALHCRCCRCCCCRADAGQVLAGQACELGAQRPAPPPAAAIWWPTERQCRRCITRIPASPPPPPSPPRCRRGEENISVIVAPIFVGFKLESLGAPADAAQRFISTTFAPEGSGKIGTLVSATSWWVGLRGAARRAAAARACRARRCQAAHVAPPAAAASTGGRAPRLPRPARAPARLPLPPVPQARRTGAAVLPVRVHHTGALVLPPQHLCLHHQVGAARPPPCWGQGRAGWPGAPGTARLAGALLGSWPACSHGARKPLPSAEPAPVRACCARPQGRPPVHAQRAVPAGPVGQGRGRAAGVSGQLQAAAAQGPQLPHQLVAGGGGGRGGCPLSRLPGCGVGVLSWNFRPTVIHTCHGVSPLRITFCRADSREQTLAEFWRPLQRSTMALCQRTSIQNAKSTGSCVARCAGGAIAGPHPPAAGLCDRLPTLCPAALSAGGRWWW